MDGATIIGFLIGLIIGGAIGCLIGAVILRAAIGIYNKLAGPSASVPEPPFGRAIVIVLATMVVNLGVGFLLGVVIGIAGAAARMDPENIGVMAQLISIPIGVFVMALMVHIMLPTTIGRALLVTLGYFLVVIAIVVAIMLVVFLVSAVL